jgi:polyisoprenoid-binding protein YceI
VSSSYTYDPDAWHPVLAGAVAGAIAAIVAALVSLPLRSPDELVANSLTVVVVSIVIGLIAGGLWRRLRATNNAEKVFSWSMVGAFFAVAAAIALADLFAFSNLIKYAGPLAVIIFITLGFFVPMLSRVTAPVWVAAIPIVLALALGVGLFGRGNVASGELSLDDLDTPSSQTTEATAGEASASASTAAAASDGTVALPSGLAASYTVSSGKATYAVEETLNGLSTQGVGSTETVSGRVTPEGAFAFDIDLTSFTSDQDRRDNKVREWFAQSPIGRFSSASFDLPDSAAVGEVITMTIPGTMTINAVEQSTEWAVAARLEDNGDLSVQGETNIVLSGFNIPVVAVPFVTMADAARIEILITLTPDA